MRPDLALHRLSERTIAQAIKLAHEALAPARPVDTLHPTIAGNRRPIATRVGDALADTGQAVWRDHTSVWTLIGRTYMAVRQFFPIYTLSPKLAIAILAGEMSAALMGPAFGRKLTPNAGNVGAHELPPVAQQALIVGLAAVSLFTFQEAEVAGTAASAAVHLGARLLPNIVVAQKAAAWAALGAYLVTAQVVFEAGARSQRTIVPAPKMVTTNSTCNGLEEICDKQICDAIFPSAHNALARPTPFTGVPAPFKYVGMAASDQLLSLDALFARGIRGFTLEYYLDKKGTLQTSHNTIWTIEPFAKTLGRFRTWLDANPREIVMLLSTAQGHYNASTMQHAYYEALDESGITKHMAAKHCPNFIVDPTNGGVPCDTRVGSLIDNDMRAIIFNGGFTESTFEAVTLASFDNFTQMYNWGGNGARTPVVMNLFSTLADWRTSDRINPLMPGLLRSYLSSVQSPSQMPTMLVGSHVETSPVLDIANELNRQPSAPGSEITCPTAQL